MTETPNEDTAKNRSGGVHLPVLPDGWHYEVQLVGPADQAVGIRPYGDGETEGPSPVGVVGPQHKLAISTGSGEIRRVEVDSLGEALKTGVQTARTLRDLAAHEAKAAQAREKLLAGIGQPSPQREDGTLDTPATLSGVNVESRGGKGVEIFSDEPARRRPMAQGGLPKSADSKDAGE